MQIVNANDNFKPVRDADMLLPRMFLSQGMLLMLQQASGLMSASSVDNGFKQHMCVL
jgi:hypothetical protein